MKTSDILSIISICVAGFTLVMSVISFLFLLFKYKHHEKLIAKLDIARAKRELYPKLRIACCQANTDCSVLEESELGDNERNLLRNKNNMRAISFGRFRTSTCIIVNTLTSENSPIFVLQNLNTVIIENSQNVDWELRLTKAILTSYMDPETKIEYKIGDKNIPIQVPANDTCSLNITYVTSRKLSIMCDNAPEKNIDKNNLYDRNLIDQQVPSSMILHNKLEIYVEVRDNQGWSTPYIFIIEYQDDILTTTSHVLTQ